LVAGSTTQDSSSSPASNPYLQDNGSRGEEEHKGLKDKVYKTFRNLAQRKSKGMLFDMSDMLDMPKAFGVEV